MSATTEPLRTPVDSYFNKLGDTVRGRPKIWKFQAKSGLILSCDHWPFVGGHFNLRAYSKERKQGWLLFRNMMGKFLERMDYIKWFAGNVSKTPSLRLIEKQSYAEKVKLSFSKESKEKAEQMRVIPMQRQQEVKQGSPLTYTNRKAKAENQKHWVIKNIDVAPTNFDPLWIVTELFAFDDWRSIRRMLETVLQVNFIINPLFDENALINLDQGSIKEQIRGEGVWQLMGSFHLKFEKWDKNKYNRLAITKRFGGWLKISNLPLDYSSRRTFEVIGDHFRALESIVSEDYQSLKL